MQEHGLDVGDTGLCIVVTLVAWVSNLLVQGFQLGCSAWIECMVCLHLWLWLLVMVLVVQGKHCRTQLA
jgi:hypothetical protein